jgi:hypothetical protein
MVMTHVPMKVDACDELTVAACLADAEVTKHSTAIPEIHARLEVILRSPRFSRWK